MLVSMMGTVPLIFFPLLLVVAIWKELTRNAQIKRDLERLEQEERWKKRIGLTD